jgi:hypothetical protein
MGEGDLLRVASVSHVTNKVTWCEELILNSSQIAPSTHVHRFDMRHSVLRFV